MRFSSLLALTVVGACSNGGFAPPALTDGGDDMPVVVDDLAGSESLPNPHACTTACDCQAVPGSRCEGGICMVTAVQVFCCGTADCTGNNLCQTPSGQVDQCNLDQDAAFTPPPGDAGAMPACVSQSCTAGAAGDVLCKLSCRTMTATCAPSVSGSGEHCMP